MCDFVAEDSNFRSEEWRKARKAHQCDAVGCDINVRPGDRYHVLTYGYEGRVARYKHCARCWAICEALWSAGAEGIDLRLDCGERWVDHWSAAEPTHLAFMTADEGQRLAPVKQ
jgi:hypothetical protein